MRRLLVAAALVSGAVVVAAGPAGAAGSGHNCLGTEVSPLAAPGFGQDVTVAAHLQLVDNAATGGFGFTGANCGNNNGQNP